MIDILLIIIFSISLTALVLGCLAYMKNEDTIKSVEMYNKDDNNPQKPPPPAGPAGPAHRPVGGAETSPSTGQPSCTVIEWNACKSDTPWRQDKIACNPNEKYKASSGLLDKTSGTLLSKTNYIIDTKCRPLPVDGKHSRVRGAKFYKAEKRDSYPEDNTVMVTSYGASDSNCGGDPIIPRQFFDPDLSTRGKTGCTHTTTTGQYPRSLCHRTTNATPLNIYRQTRCMKASPIPPAPPTPPTPPAAPTCTLKSWPQGLRSYQACGGKENKEGTYIADGECRKLGEKMHTFPEETLWYRAQPWKGWDKWADAADSISLNLYTPPVAPSWTPDDSPSSGEETWKWCDDPDLAHQWNIATNLCTVSDWAPQGQNSGFKMTCAPSSTPFPPEPPPPPVSPSSVRCTVVAWDGDEDGDDVGACVGGVPSSIGVYNYIADSTCRMLELSSQGGGQLPIYMATVNDGALTINAWDMPENGDLNDFFKNRCNKPDEKMNSIIMKFKVNGQQKCEEVDTWPGKNATYARAECTGLVPLPPLPPPPPPPPPLAPAPASLASLTYCYSKVAWDRKCGSPSSCPSSAAMILACEHATKKNITAYLNNSANPCLGRSSKGDQQLGRTSTDRLGSVPTDDVTRALECKNFLYTTMRNQLIINDLVADPPPEWVVRLTPNEKRNAFAEAENIIKSADRQFDRCIAYMQEVVEMDGRAEMGANDPFMGYYNDIMRATDLWASGELAASDVQHDSGPTCPDATNQVCSPILALP